MGARLRGVAVLVVVLVAGAFLGSALGQWWTLPVGPGPAGGAGWTGPRVRVEVLNGGGVEGRARSATDRLRDEGFDVVYFGNQSPFGRDSSVVYDRVGRVEWARAVADAMGIRTVVSEPDSNLFLDVTVVLGRDWEPGPDEQPEERPARSWWDLRRFLDDTGPGTESGGGRMADPGEDEGT